MYVVQLLLPTADNESRPYPPVLTERIERELSEKFGGITAYSRAPARGVWEHDGRRDKDNIVVVEVMVPTVDVRWWEGFRAKLESDLRQEVIVIRAHEAVQL